MHARAGVAGALGIHYFLATASLTTVHTDSTNWWSASSEQPFHVGVPCVLREVVAGDGGSNPVGVHALGVKLRMSVAAVIMLGRTVAPA